MATTVTVQKGRWTVSNAGRHGLVLRPVGVEAAPTQVPVAVWLGVIVAVVMMGVAGAHALPWGLVLIAGGALVDVVAPLTVAPPRRAPRRVWLGQQAVWLDGVPVRGGVYTHGDDLVVGAVRFRCAPLAAEVRARIAGPGAGAPEVPDGWQQSTGLEGVTLRGPRGEVWQVGATGMVLNGEVVFWADHPRVELGPGAATVVHQAGTLPVETSPMGQELLARVVARHRRGRGTSADVPQGLAELKAAS